MCSGISIDTVRLTDFEADPATVDVTIDHLLIKVPDDDHREALSSFGTVHDICLQRFDGSGICTGTRILKMFLSSEFPANFRVLRYPCQVLYRV